MISSNLGSKVGKKKITNNGIIPTTITNKYAVIIPELIKFI